MDDNKDTLYVLIKIQFFISDTPLHPSDTPLYPAMSLFCVQTHDLSWQDRTINIELMMAPARSQLLYNKHKGLKTKCEQGNYNLEREKDSYLKSFKTDILLMERRKDLYSKRRNDIILRRSTAEGRRRSASISESLGRTSAPPRLEKEPSFGGSTFITELNPRETKSAGAKPTTQEAKTILPRTPELTNITFPETPDLRTVSPCMSTRSATPGKPYLLRRKSVRFLPIHDCPHNENKSPVELTIDERIKRFLDTQADFNKRDPISITEVRRQVKQRKPPIGKRMGGLGMNLMKLEDAFDKFCGDDTPEGFEKLVKYATKMKATVRNARNSAIMPRRGSILITL